MRPFRSIPRVRQRDASDCGAACLASVAAWYRLRLPIARLRQLAHTDARGTTALGIVEAATRIGFQARGVRATADALSALPLPAIAHVVRGSLQHWVVLARVAGARRGVRAGLNQASTPSKSSCQSERSAITNRARNVIPLPNDAR